MSRVASTWWGSPDFYLTNMKQNNLHSYGLCTWIINITLFFLFKVLFPGYTGWAGAKQCMLAFKLCSVINSQNLGLVDRSCEIYLITQRNSWLDVGNTWLLCRGVNREVWTVHCSFICMVTSVVLFNSQ